MTDGGGAPQAVPAVGGKPPLPPSNDPLPPGNDGAGDNGLPPGVSKDDIDTSTSGWFIH